MDDLMNFIVDLMSTNSSENPFGQLKYTTTACKANWPCGVMAVQRKLHKMKKGLMQKKKTWNADCLDDPPVWG